MANTKTGKSNAASKPRAANTETSTAMGLNPRAAKPPKSGKKSK